MQLSMNSWQLVSDWVSGLLTNKKGHRHYARDLGFHGGWGGTRTPGTGIVSLPHANANPEALVTLQAVYQQVFKSV